MSNIVLCEDCKHFLPDGEKCGRSLRLDYVHGKHRQFGAMAERESTLREDCGANARHFELASVKVAA